MSQKKLFNDTEYKKAALNKMARGRDNPEHKKKKSESSKKMWANPMYRQKKEAEWADPIFKKKHSDAIKKSHANPDFRKRQSEDQSKRWENPVYKKQQLEAMEKGSDRPEVKEKISKASKRVWSDPEYKKKMCRISKAVQNRPEIKNNKSHIQKKNWTNPEYRKKIIEAQKKSYTPVLRKKMSEAGKKGWANPKRREQQSKRVTQEHLDGKRIASGRGFKGHYCSRKMGKNIFFRSSYEMKAYGILEKSPNVKGYKNEPFKIQYNENGYDKYCVPDILVTYYDGTKEMIEVKPEYKLNKPNEMLKIKIMREYAKNNGMEFSVWSEKELKIKKGWRIPQ